MNIGRKRIGRATGILGSGIRTVPWYLSGGIQLSNCVAAYQAIGASSALDSYINLAAPGLYDLVPTDPAPAWAVNTGWTGASGRYFNSGIRATNTFSVFVRFSNSSPNLYSTLLGARTATNGIRISPDWGTKVEYWGGGSQVVAVSPNLTSGVLAISGTNLYRNGVDEGDVVRGSINLDQYIMASNGSGTAERFLSGKIQAVAYYNIALTSIQVSAISTAMVALTENTPSFFSPTAILYDGPDWYIKPEVIV